MKNTSKSKIKDNQMHQETAPLDDDFFDRCLQKGFIEKTSYGYYFTPEFFEIIEIETKKKFSKEVR